MLDMLGILCMIALMSFAPTVVSVQKDKLVFRPLLHQPRIYAGAPPGVHVTTVHAYDPDKPRKKVQYNLPNVFDYQSFVVDQTSGNLTTAKSINKNVGETYEVMVAAVSRGSSELEHLQIAVTEFNEFAPRFEKRQYLIELHPKTEVNTSVLRVQATDPDPAPHNAEIYYKMDQNMTSKYFSFNSLTGNLMLRHPINETSSNFYFGLFAEDGGSPKRWDYVPVYVILKNISAPLYVNVMNVTYFSAEMCWEEPLFGDVVGYEITYYPEFSPVPQQVNVTDTCLTILSLEDDTEYVAQVYGWNEKEKGLTSPVLRFRTAQNWCKKFLCQAGSCEPLTHEPWHICHCPLGYYGSVCEYFDPCSTNPCGSNGKCRNTTNNQYACICHEDYSGPNCGSYNPCLGNPNLCENGGTCEMTTDHIFICICSDQFYGQKCEHTNFCSSNPCFNGGTCQQNSHDNIKCLCPPGFTGPLCVQESEENFCASVPCSNGSTCINLRDTYSCICTPGHTGHTCNITSQCPPDTTDTDQGLYYWNATNFGAMVVIKCPFGPLDSVEGEGYATRQCLLLNDEATWSVVNASECKTKDFVVADELADELHNMTNNPTSLNAETLEAATQGIQTISTYATKDKKLAQDMVDVISNVLDVNDTVLSQGEHGKLTDNILQTIDDFASNVELKPGEYLSIRSENVQIHSVEWHPDEVYEEHIEFSAPMEKGTEEGESRISPTHPPEKSKVPVFQVFVPKEALQEAHRQLDRSVRFKFVVYYNDKLFQSKQPAQSTSEDKTETRVKEDKVSNNIESGINPEPSLTVPVLQISVGNLSLTNLDKPLIYILPMATTKKAFCVYWDNKETKWSTKGLKTNQTSTKVICQSSHMTAFSVLLDLTPDEKPNETHSAILSITSYVGSFLSIIGLSLTILTYSLFGCLNRDYPGKILLNLCFSLLLLNTVFLIGSSNFVINLNACAALALLTHYFVLTSLSWMCAEAVNMHHLLVHVFASSETHFMLKRFCVAWGTPLFIVVVTAIVKFEAYSSNAETCILSSHDPWVYYCTFLGPSCLILFTNFVLFLLVSKVIFTPKLAVRTSPEHSAKVTAAQVRGAFTVMVLLGITWVFGTMAVGRVKLVFQYFFCLSNSLQGFLIFLVRCLLYPEARNAWLYLLQSGKLKRHRGVLPPGTVSFSSNSGGRNGLSPNATVRTESLEDSTSFVNTSYRNEHSSKIVRNSPRTMSIKYKRGERPAHCVRFINKSSESNGKALNGRNYNGDHDNEGQTNRKLKIENPKKNSKTAHNAFKWRHPRQYAEESRRNAHSSHSRVPNYSSEKRADRSSVTVRVNPLPDSNYLYKLYPVEAQLQKDRRSASVDGFSPHKGSIVLENGPIRGKRSMSLDVKCQMIAKRGAPVSRRKWPTNGIITPNSTLSEADEGVQFDKSSSSTDVDDESSTSDLDGVLLTPIKDDLDPPPIISTQAQLTTNPSEFLFNNQSNMPLSPLEGLTNPDSNPVFLKCKRRTPMEKREEAN